MLVGYVRVSTLEQNASLQIDALQQAGCERIFQDKVTGAKTEQCNNTRRYQQAHAGHHRAAVWHLQAFLKCNTTGPITWRQSISQIQHFLVSTRKANWNIRNFEMLSQFHCMLTRL